MTTTDHAIVAPAVTGDPGTRADAGGFDPGRAGNRMPPPTPEQEARAAETRAKVQEARAAFERLPPVEQAMHRMDQKRSFVRGQCGRDDALLKEPEYVVLAAYRELLKSAPAAPDPIPQPEGDAPPAPASRDDDDTVTINVGSYEQGLLDALNYPEKARRVVLAGDRSAKLRDAAPPAPAQSAGAAADGEDDAALELSVDADPKVPGLSEHHLQQMRLELEEAAERGDTRLGRCESFTPVSAAVLLGEVATYRELARRGAQPHEPADASARSARGEVAEVVLSQHEIEMLFEDWLAEVDNFDHVEAQETNEHAAQVGFVAGFQAARPTPAAVLDRARPAGQGEGEPVAWQCRLLPDTKWHEVSLREIDDYKQAYPGRDWRPLYATPTLELAGWQWRNSQEDFWHFSADQERAAWEASLYKFGKVRSLYAIPPSAAAAPPAPASREDGLGGADLAEALSASILRHKIKGDVPNDVLLLMKAARNHLSRATSAPAQDAGPAGVTEAERVAARTAANRANAFWCNENGLGLVETIADAALDAAARARTPDAGKETER